MADYSINVLTAEGKATQIFIHDEKISAIKNGFGEDANFDLRDKVVLPPLIDGHNHPVPYNFSNPDDFWGEHKKNLGNFGSRFEWRALVKAKEDELRAIRDRLKQQREDGACVMYQYASMLDVGAAVIQGLKAPDQGLCESDGALGIAEIVPKVAELTLLYEPGDTLEKTRGSRLKDLDKLSKSDLAIVHLAEGRVGNPDIEEEIQRAYYTDVMLEGGNVIIHGNALEEADLKHLQAIGSGIVWSPVSQNTLYSREGIFDVKRALEMGLVIGLGSDWNLSGSSNILREMAAAQVYLEDLYAYDSGTAAQLILDMASVNNAKLFHLDEYDGIEEGNVASLIFVPEDAIFKNGKLDLSGLDESDVSLQLMRGKAILGDSDLLARFSAVAEPLEAPASCRETGTKKSVSFTPRRFAEIQAIMKEYFPNVPDLLRCDENRQE